MNTFSAKLCKASTTAHLSHTLERGEVERRVKAAVQSGSPGQVECVDASVLVGCVDWYQYDTPSSGERPH